MRAYYQVIFLVFSFAFIKSNAQEACTYEKYFSEVRIALTKKYSDNDYQAANDKFKSAFKSVPFQLGKDLEEALEVSIAVHDQSQSKYIVYQLAKGGIPKQYFERHPELKQFDWWIEFEQNLINLNVIIKNIFNLTLKKELLDLRTQDSLFNVKYHKYRRGEIKLSEQKLINGGEHFVNTFISIWEKHGFPSERNMGYFYVGNEIQEYPLRVILTHLEQLGENLLNDKYDELVCKGHLRKYQFKQLLNIISIGGNKGVHHELKLFYKQYKKDRA